MEAGFQLFLILLAVLAGISLLARKLDIAPAILLLATGIGLAMIPGVPRVELAPDLVLLLMLPPLIYSASVAMSWRDFKANLRPIAFLAIGCVLFTACAVATATHYLLGLPWGVGFLLGAIVAPPDVVAPLAIARRLRLPRRILVILEGEGLVNDATALILYRFAVVAISTGAFSLPRASATFAAIVICEIVFGLAVGWLSLRLRKWADSPKVEIIFSLITPYLAFWIPEHFGGSGVLATVACGLYISWNGPLLISSATRLQGVFFWDLAIYLTEGALFLLTGFQMRILIEKSKEFPLTDILIAIAPRIRCGRDRTVRLGIPGHLSGADRGPQADARRSMAAGVRGRVHRRARRGLACGGAGIAVDTAGWRRISLSRHDPVHRLRRHLRDAGGAGPDLAAGGQAARHQPFRQ